MSETDTDSRGADVASGDRAMAGERPVNRVSEAAGSRHVSFAVGVFAAFGVGLVLAAFMGSAFTSGNGSGVGLAASVSFALTVAPLLAVLTGTWAARSDGDATGGALSATFGGLAGVFGLYVAHYVFGGALGVSTGTVSIGPLFGWAVGVGLTAGGTAFLVQAIETRSAGLDVGVSRRSLAYPAGAFVAVGVGLVIALFAAGELASSSTGAFSGFGANPAASAPTTLVTFAPLLGFVAGFVSVSEGDERSRVGAALLGAGGGFVLAYVVVFGLAHVLESDAMEGVTLQLGPIVGVAVGAAIASGLGAWIADAKRPGVS